MFAHRQGLDGNTKKGELAVLRGGPVCLGLHFSNPLLHSSCPPSLARGWVMGLSAAGAPGARARGETGQQFLGLEQAAPGVCSLGQRGCEGRAAKRDRAQLTRPSEGGRWWGVVEGPHLLGENQAGPRIKEDSMQVAREGGDTFGSLMEVEGGFPHCHLVCPSQPGGH